MNGTTEKKKKAKKAKPLRRAQRFGREVPSMAIKLLLTLVGVSVMNLFFSALQAVEAPWLRISLSLTIAVGILMLYFGEGMSKGVVDAQRSRRCEALIAQERRISEKEDAECYHPLKALLAAVCVFALPLATAAYLGVNAKEYTYTMQDVPVWLTNTYGSRADVMAPLGAYGPTQVMTATDWIRVIVRLPLMVYINLFSDPVRTSAMIDRLSVLMMAIGPLAFVAGYLFAPPVAHKRALKNKRAKKVAVRKAQKKTLAEELVGDQHGVHYGKKVVKEHKKKELI